MQRFDTLTEAEMNEIAAIAESHGMSQEHLQAIAKAPRRFEPDAALDDAERGFVKPERKSGQAFHFGESQSGVRHP